MAVLNTCCTISLRTGALIIGSIEFVLAVLGLFATIVGVELIHEKSTKEEKEDVEEREEEKEAEETIKHEEPLLGIVFAILLIIVSLLIVGVLRRKSKFMLPYLILSAIGVVLSAMITLFFLFSNSFWYSVGRIIGLGIKTYLTLVVFSYYQTLTETEGQVHQPPPENITASLAASAPPYYPSDQVIMTTKDYQE